MGIGGEAARVCRDVFLEIGGKPHDIFPAAIASDCTPAVACERLRDHIESQNPALKGKCRLEVFEGSSAAALIGDSTEILYVDIAGVRQGPRPRKGGAG